MESTRDADYRLRLARGFLAEADEDLRLSRWRSCVDNSQLAVENSAKSVIARFGPVPRSHDVAAILAEHVGRGVIPQALRTPVDHLVDLSRQLGYEEHIRSDYGEEARGITPWDLFQEADTLRAIEIARRAVSVAEDIASR